MAFTRVSLKIGDLKTSLDEYTETKISKPMSKDPQLLHDLAYEWAMAVNKYVPRSSRKDRSGKAPRHHLQQFYLDGNRVKWTRLATYTSDEVSKGEDIADRLYKEGPIRGTFRSRPDSPWQPHMPTDHWDENVRPGTPDWEEFIKTITPDCIDWINNQT